MTEWAIEEGGCRHYTAKQIDLVFMFRVQFDPCDANRDSVVLSTFDEAWGAVSARYPEAQRQKRWDLLGSSSNPTWEGATLKVWPDRAARNSEYVQNQRANQEPDCLGGSAVAVIVNLSEAPPEPQARLTLQGSRCRQPDPGTSGASAPPAVAEGWLGCFVKSSSDAGTGAIKYEWLSRPIIVLVPATGQQTMSLACPNCGRTVRIGAMSRRWTIAVGLARLALVLLMSLGGAVVAGVPLAYAKWPLWMAVLGPVPPFVFFTWVGHSSPGMICWTWPLLKPRFIEYARIVGGRGKGVMFNDGRPFRYTHELYNEAQAESKGLTPPRN